MINISNENFWLIDQAYRHPEKIALLTTNEKLSYKELLDLCNRTIQYFNDNGIKKNDHVGILFAHRKEFWIIVNSLWLIGAVPVPLNTRNTSVEINEQILQANIKFLVIDGDFENNLYSTDQFLISNPGNIFFFDSKKKFEFSETEFLFNNLAFNCQHSALILFTSGSSGKSKAVVHTFESLFESVRLIDSFCDLSENDTWLASLPLYHIGGFMILVRSLITGSCAAFPDSLQHEKIRPSLEKFQPTHISFVPTTLSRLLSENVEVNKKLKFVFLGGGPSGKQLCLDAFSSGWPIVKVYGSSETCSMVAALPPEKLIACPSSSGKPLGDTKIKIINGIEGQGEIAISGKTLFKEYYNDPDETDKQKKSGWYHTGDLGKIDDNGYLVVFSRREDLIVTGGENVSSLEVEKALRNIPGICDAYVFSLEDKAWGQIVCAAVTATNIDEEKVLTSLKEKLAGYKIPKQIYFVDTIPKNEMGKINRAKLFTLLNLD